MTITNPEKGCKTTPESFSEESKITHVETVDYRRGIILGNMEELENALRIYNGDVVPGSRATTDKLGRIIAQDHGPLGLGLFALGDDELRGKQDFVGNILSEARPALEERGRFRKRFDYALGSNFVKTAVEVEKVGDKYVLKLDAAYVGSEPEENLAAILAKPRALVRSSANGRLSVVDGWWFNVNLEDVLAGLPISKEQREKFEHEGQKFSLDIYLDADGYLRPEGGKEGSEYMQTRGNNIVGGAWTKRGNMIAPTVVQPAVVFSVSLPGGEKYSRPVAVTEDQMKAVQAARDYLADLIRVR